jgi:hypothetical protein
MSILEIFLIILRTCQIIQHLYCIFSLMAIQWSKKKKNLIQWQDIVFGEKLTRCTVMIISIHQTAGDSSLGLTQISL